MIVGLDIGSRSIELVGLVDGVTELTLRVPTTFDPISQCTKLLDGLRPRSEERRVGKECRL